jgi:hypothetical protein
MGPNPESPSRSIYEPATGVTLSSTGLDGEGQSSPNTIRAAFGAFNDRASVLAWSRFRQTSSELLTHMGVAMCYMESSAPLTQFTR